MPQDDKGLFAALMERFSGQPQLPPDIQEAINIAKKERPDLADVETYGPISKMLLGRAQGYISPGKTIYLNPDQLKGLGKQDIADTIIHEQTHVDQMNRKGQGALGKIWEMMTTPNEPYGQRPDEIEAFQVEQHRRDRMRRPQTAVPSFTTPGEYRIPSDIHLSKK